MALFHKKGRADTGRARVQRMPAGAAAPLPATSRQGRLDAVLLVIIFAMLIYGIIMVFSASYPAALHKTSNSLHFISKHVLFVAGGIIIMLLASLVDYHIYRRFVFPLFILGIVLLILVRVPGIGTNLNTFAYRWIEIGSVTFQPSEFVKFTMILMFSHLIALNYKRMGTFQYGVVPFGICLLLVAGLMMLQPHLSGTILIFMVGLIMMFVGGTKLRWFGVLGGAGALGVVAIAFIKGATYITERLSSWLDPFNAENIRDETWQTVQSLIAIGSGGVMGRGIGNSRTKYLFLPEPYNDYIFSIICEELGLVGAMLTMILFVLFAFRGYSIAQKAPDKFGYMMAVGIVTQIIVQAVLNMAVVTNTIPSTGISLPFFSYGGTSLLMLMGEVGILLNISRQSVMEKT